MTLSQQQPGLMLPVRVIPLTQGQFTIVDPEDYEELSRWKWYAKRGRYTWYAGRNVPLEQQRYRTLYMHSQLTGFQQTDHANSDGLDNTRRNLRAATHSQNNANRRLFSNNTSGRRGVSWRRAAGKWRAQIMIHGKAMDLGLFADLDDAVAVYQAAAQDHFGEFAPPSTHSPTRGGQVQYPPLNIGSIQVFCSGCWGGDHGACEAPCDCTHETVTPRRLARLGQLIRPGRTRKGTRR